MCRGDYENEAFLVQLPMDLRSLRSRNAYLILDRRAHKITIWFGSKVLNNHREIARSLAKKIQQLQNLEFRLEYSYSPLTIDEIEEGHETSANCCLCSISFENRNEFYHSLLNDQKLYNFTPRLFYLSSVCGTFTATELYSSFASDQISPFPFSQSDLYNYPQPCKC